MQPRHHSPEKKRSEHVRSSPGKQHGGVMHSESHLQAEKHSRATHSGGEGDWLQGEEDFFKDFFVARALRLNFNYLFFPGLVAHELAHVLGAWLGGVRVGKIVFWSPRGGYVVHQRARGSSSVVISLAPFVFNNALAVFFLQDSLNAFSSVGGFGYGLFAFWLAFSFAIYSFPSMHDLRSSVEGLRRSMEKWSSMRDAVSKVLSLVVLPLVYFFYLIFITMMAVFAAGPGSRMLWFFLVFAVVASGAFSEILAKFS